MNKSYLEEKIIELLGNNSLSRELIQISFFHNSIAIRLRKITLWFYYDKKKMLVENNESYSNKITRTFAEWIKFRKNWGRDAVNGFYSAQLRSLSIEPTEFIKRYWPFFLDMFDLINDLDLSFNNKNPINLIPLNNTIDQFSDIKQQNWYNRLLKDYTEYCQSKNKSDIMENYYQEQARLHGLKFIKNKV